jgi:hypothetical protein
MGKRMVARILFTEIILNSLCKPAEFKCEPIRQLPFFEDITKHPLSNNASDWFTCYLSRLCFSADTKSMLNESLLLGAGKDPLLFSPSPHTINQFRLIDCSHILPWTHDTRRSKMRGSNRSIYFHRLTNLPASASSVDFGRKENSKNTSPITERQQLSFTTSTIGKPEAISFSAKRCSEKGCVFPALSPCNEKCSYHLHQQEEPVLFRSHQPTGLLLDPARSAPTEKEYDGSRKRDRRRMAAIWEQFQSDGTP